MYRDPGENLPGFQTFYNHSESVFTINTSQHKYYDSILFDNCYSIYLVNNIDRLDPGLLRRPKANNAFVVLYGTQNVRIISYGTRIIKGILTEGRMLKLNNVAYVKGFHVNIVSETRLKDKNVWYNGLDCIIRMGSRENNILLCRLERRNNIIFLQYKTPVNYLRVPFTLFVSFAGIISSEAISGWIKIPRMQKGSSMGIYDEKEDNLLIWYRRAGHLGPETLNALVQRAKGVKIKRPAFLECDTCAQIYGKTVVSRRLREEPYRPYYIIYFNLFHFEKLGTGYKYLLLLKDKYTGRLTAVPLTGKNSSELVITIFGFKQWLIRQYGLQMAKFFHNNKPALVAHVGYTYY